MVLPLPIQRGEDYVASKPRRWSSLQIRERKRKTHKKWRLWFCSLSHGNLQFHLLSVVLIQTPTFPMLIKIIIAFPTILNLISFPILVNSLFFLNSPLTPQSQVLFITSQNYHSSLVFSSLQIFSPVKQNCIFRWIT